MINFSPFSFTFWRSIFLSGGGLVFAALFISISGKLFEDRSSASVVSGQTNSMMMLRAALIVLALLIVFKYFRKVAIPRSLAFKAVLIYALIALISVTWSYVPIATIGKSVELIVGCLVIWVALSCKNADKKLVAIYFAIMGSIFIQLSIVFIGYALGVDEFREAGAGGVSELIGERAVAPFISANGVGYFSTLMIAFLFNIYLVRALSLRGLIVFGLLAISTLLLSGSRTSLAMAAIVIILGMFKLHKKLLMYIFIPGLILILALSAQEIFAFLQGETPDSNFTSLSGRTLLWESALNHFLDEPMLGEGFGVGSRVVFYLAPLEGFDETISTVHNGPMELLLGVGIVGFIPWIFSMFVMIAYAVKSYGVGDARESIIVSTMPVLVGVTIMSVGLGGALNEFTMIFLVILAYRDYQFRGDVVMHRFRQGIDKA